MKVTVAAAALCLLVPSPASAQALAGARPDVILDQASACIGGPSFAGIAERASARGWTELRRRDALKLQAIADDRAELRAWSIPDIGAGPSWLVVEAPPTLRPRAFSCELVFFGVEGSTMAAAMQEWNQGFGPLGLPTLSGPFAAGGSFHEFRPPEGSPWRVVSLTREPPPRRGPQRSRIRFSGVEN